MTNPILMQTETFAWMPPVTASGKELQEKNRYERRIELAFEGFSSMSEDGR